MTRPTLSHILGPPRSRPPPAEAYGQYPSSTSSSFAGQSHLTGPGPSREIVGDGYPADLPNQPKVAPSTPLDNVSQTTSETSNHKDKNLYACRDCGRSYSRPEHLVRHVQTHTLGRRFICEICQKGFARKDLLKRHFDGHADESPHKRRRNASSPGPGRVSQACRPCALARVKCDDSKPCRRCVNRNLACVSSDSGSATSMRVAHVSSNTSATNNDEPSRSVMSSRLGPGNSVTGSVESSSPASYDIPQFIQDTSSRATPQSQTASTEAQDGQVPTPETPDTSFQMSQNALPRSISTLGPADPTIMSAEVSATSVPFPPQYNPSAAAFDTARMPYFDFLRDVLYEQPYDTSKLADSQRLDVLDYANDANLELTDMDLGLLDLWNADSLMGSAVPPQEMAQLTGQTTAEISQMRQSLKNVWTDSPWRWNPDLTDSAFKDQENLPTSERETASVQFQEQHERLERVIDEKLIRSNRDKALAVVLNICRTHADINRVSASFPSLDVMDTLVHIWLAAHECQVSKWLHFPTFKLNEQHPEWTAIVAAAGAVLTPFPTLRKFGFSVQEAVRLTVPQRIEENNINIQNFGYIQAMVIWQDLGLWSGNRRKMEIAECHIQVPVAMMRYRSKFLRSKYPTIEIDPDEEGETLVQKWRLWVEREQWKRLIFHCFLRDAQNSMTTLTNPTISYSDMSMPLPEARELWFAEDAQAWKTQYLQRSAGYKERAPSVGDLFHDIQLLQANDERLDIQYSISIYLHGYWALILEYQHLSSVLKSRSYADNLGGNQNLLLQSRHESLVKDLQSFQLVASAWRAISAQEHLLLNLLLMNLHVSLDDLQLFSGKEGEDQARRIYPVLQEWTVSAESRSAVWCASQILRYAKSFPAGHLKDFYAVAVHHASLAMWTYGVIVRASRRHQPQANLGYEPIYLDGTDSVAIQRFIGLEQGQPMIRGPNVPGGSMAEASLHDPRACMEVMKDTLQSNFKPGNESMPPIVENLSKLIRQLGTAAWAVGLG